MYNEISANLADCRLNHCWVFRGCAILEHPKRQTWSVVHFQGWARLVQLRYYWFCRLMSADVAEYRSRFAVSFLGCICCPVQSPRTNVSNGECRDLFRCQKRQKRQLNWWIMTITIIIATITKLGATYSYRWFPLGQVLPFLLHLFIYLIIFLFAYWLNSAGHIPQCPTISCWFQVILNFPENW